MKNMSNYCLTCYCGQDGDQKLNMLQCVKCKHWFHEDCVKCLDMPMLYGDRFYIFICSLCNAGSECLARLEMKWAEIIQLLLYNLTIEHKKKYFDLDASVVPFLYENWERFHILGPATRVHHILEDSGRVTQYVDKHCLANKRHLGDLVAKSVHPALKCRPFNCEPS
ncbi:metal-response element-binding transcription factor 2-like [Stegodyphus dumicola]|uniref:metal-response element-binding transcription factor 2-like n=1 Tax=Stegodyphus dumicola TaxID=202533 RepID=UPI0015B05A9B|nr:metal-response element-binding transcription factor 2-like [Stegodyphus dumicola]